jgi:hypothetical protein
MAVGKIQKLPVPKTPAKCKGRFVFYLMGG